MEETWIDIREQPPDREGRYRVKTRSSSSAMIRYFFEGEFYSSGGFNRDKKKPLKVTHWMRIPEEKTA